MSQFELAGVHSLHLCGAGPSQQSVHTSPGGTGQWETPYRVSEGYSRDWHKTLTSHAVSSLPTS